MKLESKLRLENREAVRQAMRNGGCITKQEAAAAANISVMTAGTIISELETAGEVLRGPQQPSAGGRPAATFRLNPEFAYALALNIAFAESGQEIRIAVFNVLGEAVEQQQIPLPANSGTPFITAALDPLFARYPKIQTLAVLLPGFEKPDGTLSQVQPALSDLLLALRRRYARPVLFENDTNAAILGWAASRPDCRGAAVGLFFPRQEPPGAGIVLNGALYHGKASFAGEFACLPMPVSWETLDYSAVDETAENVARAAALFCCTIAPEALVLYGDFFSPQLQDAVRARTAALLRGAFSCSLCFSSSVSADQAAGLQYLTLRALREEIAKLA